MKKRLKDVCLISGKSNRKNYGKTCTFLPMEKIYSGSYSSDLKISYGEENKGYTYIRNGEVIRAIVTPCFENLKGAYVENLKEGFAIGSTEVMTLSPSKINPKILYYIIMSQGFIDFCLQHMKGVGGLKRINPKKSLEYPVNKAVLCEQDRIINFLDGQCDKIDTEISLLEKKSKLLEEYKQSLIFETVTKGLDKNAKMKDSEVEWIGEIPQESKIVKFKNLYSKTNSGEVISKEYWSNNGLNLYSCSKEVLKTNFSNFPQNKLTKNNDLLITRNATPYIFIPESNSLYTNVVQRITLKKHLAIKYIYYVLSVSSKYILSYGDIIASLNMSMWNDISVVLHSKEEQILIAQFLDQQTSKIDQNINLINKKIELLKEYKQSLIHEAVTGQLEI